MALTVAQLQQAAQDAVASTMAEANGHLQSLVNAANVVFSNGFNVDELLPDAYNYASTPNVDFPLAFGGDRPTVTVESDAAGPPEAPTFDIPALQEIGLPADDLLAHTHNFLYAEAAYESVLLDSLKAKLLNDLLNGGTGIEPGVEAALLQRTRERGEEVNLMGVGAAGSFMAARGFPLPPDAEELHLQRAQQRVQTVGSSLERDIRLDRSQRSVDNRRFVMQQSRELESVLIQFHNSVNERTLNAAKATQELSILVYNALVARFRARLERTKLSSDMQEVRVRAELARIQAFLERYRGQIAGYEANLRRLVEAAQLRVSLYRADIEANRDVTQGLIARTQLQMKVIEATAQNNIDISRVAIENAKAKLQAVVSALHFKTEAAKFGAEMWFAKLIAMMGAINSLTVTSAED